MTHTNVVLKKIKSELLDLTFAIEDDAKVFTNIYYKLVFLKDSNDIDILKEGIGEMLNLLKDNVFETSRINNKDISLDQYEMSSAHSVSTDSGDGGHNIH